MAETLLSPSNVMLFGREIDDLQVVIPPPIAHAKVGLASAVGEVIAFPGDFPATLDGVSTANVRRILLKDQTTVGQRAVYKRNKQNKLEKVELPESPYYVKVRLGSVANRGNVFKVESNGTVSLEPQGDVRHTPSSEFRSGLKSEIEQQLHPDSQPILARIYAFSFEGYYYELPRPVLFLVHGEGIPASEARTGVSGKFNVARAPGDPSLTGMSSADFQFSDDVMVWSYDKADYTIRMDVESGMFEQVLLDAMLGGPGGMDAAGMNARGMNARGMNARGMNARGMNARGMNARGGNSD